MSKSNCFTFKVEICFNFVIKTSILYGNFWKNIMCYFYYCFKIIAFYNLNSFIFRLKNCLQEGDDIPNDHTKLFDLSLYKMDNNVLPDVLRFIVIEL